MVGIEMMESGRDIAQRLSQQAPVPACVAGWGRLVQLLQHPLFCCLVVTPLQTGSRRILQARQALLDKTLSPLADGRHSHLLAVGDAGRALVSCCSQDDPRAQGEALFGGRTTTPILQSRSNLWGNLGVPIYYYLLGRKLLATSSSTRS